LTPQVLPYANAIIWLSPDLFVRAGVHSINAFAVLFLILICGNVALLVFTRAATREREILVRTALGATRGRILAQLVVESLVLATLAAGLGLTATNALLKAASERLGAGPDRWPFWFDGGLSSTTAIYAGALTILAAAIVGVVPGLKIVGRRMSDRLRQSTAGGGGLRMGGVWTGLIVAQIAATVVFSATAYVVHRQAAYIASVETVFPAAKYLSVRLEMDPEGPAEQAAETVPERFRQRYAGAVGELERRLSAEATVAGVTVAEWLPLAPTTDLRAIEVDGASPEEPSSRWKVGASAVAPDFFEVFQMPVLAGRGFDSRDLDESANTVVVNNLFADQILGGGNVIGRRIRYESLQDADESQSPVEPGPWLEVVGVVRDLAPGRRAPLNLDNPARPRLYRALSPRQESYPLYLAVHASDPESLTPALRRIAEDVSPTLRLHDILPLDSATSEDARYWRILTNLILLASAIALALSLAGIYSVMSVTVSRRTREIGVRVALGAPTALLVAEIFRRPFILVGGGVIVGCGLVGAVVAFANSGSGVAMAGNAALLLGYGIAMLGVCALACIGPIVRALRVEPVEALKDDV
jgi:predicted permease